MCKVFYVQFTGEVYVKREEEQLCNVQLCNVQIVQYASCAMCKVCKLSREVYVKRRGGGGAVVLTSAPGVC